MTQQKSFLATYDQLRNHIVQETGSSLIDDDLDMAIRVYEGHDDL